MPRRRILERDLYEDYHRDLADDIFDRVGFFVFRMSRPPGRRVVGEVNEWNDRFWKYARLKSRELAGHLLQEFSSRLEAGPYHAMSIDVVPYAEGFSEDVLSVAYTLFQQDPSGFGSINEAALEQDIYRLSIYISFTALKHFQDFLSHYRALTTEF